MTDSSRIAGQSLYFLFGNIFTLIVGFAFQVYLARVLGAQGIGLFGLVESYVALATGVLAFGLANAALKFIPELREKGDSTSVLKIFWTGSLVMLALGSAVVLTVVVFSRSLLTHWPELSSHPGLVVMGALLVPIGLLTNYVIHVLRGCYNVRHVVNATSFLQLILKVLIAVAVFQFSASVAGYLAAVIISSLVALLWLIAGVFRELGGFKRPVLGWNSEWGRYAWTMYRTFLSIFWVRPFEKIVIGAYLGASSVGLVVIATTLSGLALVFLQMFISITAPMLSGAFSRGDLAAVSHQYQLTTDWIVRLSLPLLVFMLVFAQEVLIIFGPAFVEGALLLRLLTLAQLFNLVCGPVGNVLSMCGQEKRLMRLTIESVLAGLPVFLLLLPVIGVNAAGVGVLISTVYVNARSVRIASGQLGVEWLSHRQRRWLLPLAVIVPLSVVVSAYGPDMSPFLLVSVLIALYVAFHVTFFVASGLDEDDAALIENVRSHARIWRSQH